MVLVRGDHGDAEIRLAGSLAVRYGDVPEKAPSEVVVDRKGQEPSTLIAECAREEDYIPLRIALNA